MKSQSYKIAQLMLVPGAKSSSASEIFVAQPDAAKEELAGKLFVIIEAESRRAEGLKIINFLIENLNHSYYQNEKMILRERVKAIKVEHIFESALAKTNKNLAEFLRAEKIKISPGGINAVIGVIHEDSLSFANIGKNKALLIYPAPQKNISAAKSPQHSYKIMDIIGQSAKSTEKTNREREKEKPINANKIFSSVISGKLPAGGYFLFANEALTEYLSPRQLIEIITALPPAGAVEQIKNIISRVNSYVSFLGLIVKNTTGNEEKELTREAPRSAQASIANLNVTEEKTEKLLAPGGQLRPRKWLVAAGKKINALLEVAVRAAKTLKNIILYSLNFAIHFLKLLFDREKRKELSAKIKSAAANTRQKIKGWRIWFGGLSKKNKILLLVILACLILFSLSLFLTIFKNNQKEKNLAAAELVKLIEQKENQIEASLLYNNEEGAKKLLAEVKGLLEQLPQEKQKQIDVYAPLFAKYNVSLEKIGHVIKVEKAEEVADFSPLDASANPLNMVLVSGKIYAADPAQKSVYKLEVDKKLVTAVAIAEAETLKYPAVDKNNNIYYFNGSDVIQLSAETDEIKKLAIETPDGAENIAAGANFNNKLYLLQTAANQIYVYAKAGNGFAAPIGWLPAGADLSGATSISIDGSIYVLKNNGEASKYLKGEKEDFALASVEPALESPIKITAESESDYVYVLEPSKKRLLVYDKTGKFISQYKFEQFNDLKDFAIDEARKAIYLLNGSSVYKTEATHLK